MKKKVKIFDPPDMAFLALTIINGLEGMHFGHFWPPPRPLGGVRGGRGGSGGEGQNCTGQKCMKHELVLLMFFVLKGLDDRL